MLFKGKSCTSEGPKTKQRTNSVSFCSDGAECCNIRWLSFTRYAQVCVCVRAHSRECVLTTCHVNAHCATHSFAHSAEQQENLQQSSSLFASWLTARPSSELSTKAYLYFLVESVAFGVALCVDRCECKCVRVCIYCQQ